MKSRKDEIAALKARLDNEKKKNAVLRKKIARLRTENDRAHISGSYSSLMTSGLFLLYSDSYFSYIAESLKRTPTYSRWDRFLLCFRRLRVISVSFRIMTYIFAFVQTSAALILLFSIMIVALPSFLIISAITVFATLIESYRSNRTVERLLREKKGYVFLALSANAFEEGSFFRSNVEEFSRDTRALVIVVSPFLFSSRGLYGNTPFISAKSENHSILIVRKNYFYSLRKKVLNKHHDKITIVS